MAKERRQDLVDITIKIIMVMTRSDFLTEFVIKIIYTKRQDLLEKQQGGSTLVWTPTKYPDTTSYIYVCPESVWLGLWKETTTSRCIKRAYNIQCNFISKWLLQYQNLIFLSNTI